MAKPQYERENLGTMVVFLLPSVQLKKKGRRGTTLEYRLHDFLLQKFKGYTASMANVFGYWVNSKKKEFYGEHTEYKVSLLDRKHIVALEEFLIKLAVEMKEESIYMAAGDHSWLLYPKKK